MKKLVLNKRGGEILSLTCNLLPTSCRLDTLEGRQFTVVPMVILTEGVHCGSMGPILYPKDELSKTPEVWNHKPIVVYHPTMNGQGVSACDPTIINSRKVGVMLNTRFEDGKLKSEAWIEAGRANQVDERIMTAVDNNEMMELSTGVFVDVEEGEGEFSGEPYAGIARNYRPDHLALLPDQIGACSIADGAGFLRNQARARNVTEESLRQALHKLGLTGNELSHDDIRVALSGKLRERIAPGQQDPMLWIMDVYQNFVVYEFEGTLYRLGFTSNDTEVQLSDETPVEVVRVSEYRTVNNQEQSNQDGSLMNKEKLIAGIIGNKGWEEADRETLNGMSEAQLTRIHDGLTGNEGEGNEPAAQPASNAKTEEPAKAEPKAEPAKAEPVANAKQEPEKVVSLQDYIQNAPKEIAEVLNEGVSTLNQQKDQVVNAIMANENNTFTKEELNTRPLGELKKIASLMGAKKPTTPNAPDYSGQGPVDNLNMEVEEVLEMPAVDFSK